MKNCTDGLLLTPQNAVIALLGERTSLSRGGSQVKQSMTGAHFWLLTSRALAWQYTKDSEDYANMFPSSVVTSLPDKAKPDGKEQASLEEWAEEAATAELEEGKQLHEVSMSTAIASANKRQHVCER